MLRSSASELPFHLPIITKPETICIKGINIQEEVLTSKLATFSGSAVFFHPPACRRPHFPSVFVQGVNRGDRALDAPDGRYASPFSRFFSNLPQAVTNSSPRDWLAGVAEEMAEKIRRYSHPVVVPYCSGMPSYCPRASRSLKSETLQLRRENEALSCRLKLHEDPVAS